jgi:hypothetical protein
VSATDIATARVEPGSSTVVDEHRPSLRELYGRLRRVDFNEAEVRVAAGLTMAIGAVAFSFAYFRREYIPLQAVTSFFTLEFIIRLTLGLRYSPAGWLSQALVADKPVEWVSARPKRFAWTLGLMMAGSMAVITNIGVRGWTPRTICLICLTLMWLESVAGLCVGCKLHAFLVRRGWRSPDPDLVCAGGVCQLPERAVDTSI